MQVVMLPEEEIFCFSQELLLLPPLSILQTQVPLWLPNMLIVSPSQMQIFFISSHLYKKIIQFDGKVLGVTDTNGITVCIEHATIKSCLLCSALCHDFLFFSLKCKHHLSVFSVLQNNMWCCCICKRSSTHVFALLEIVTQPLRFPFNQEFWTHF